MLRALLLPVAGALVGGGVLAGGRVGKLMVGAGTLLFSLAVLLVLTDL